MLITFANSISQITASAWDALRQDCDPFTSHAFLLALEISGSVSEQTGWKVSHLCAWKEERLIAAMPLYIKSHSYGEYVFDWSWANAYQEHGVEYYPKLISAIPFSPVTGERLLYDATYFTPDNEYQNINNAILELAHQIGASSWHVLFPRQVESLLLQNSGLQHRSGCQYHWFNEKFSDFDDFLSTFASRKRKNIRKERLAVFNQEIELEALEGHNITRAHWQSFYRFYQLTYMKRRSQAYLNQDFFDDIANTLKDNLVMVVASKNQQHLACALYLKSEDTLYGRYWGCEEEYDKLHFEACYYQGIEYCIKHGIKHFDPGAQGEHKILRGFIPIFTHSCHWIAHEGFKQAIGKFLKEEHEHIAAYRDDACTALPFNQKYLETSAHKELMLTGHLDTLQLGE